MRELNVVELSLVAGAYSRGAIVYRVEPAPIDSSGGLNIADLYTRLAEICARNGGYFQLILLREHYPVVYSVE